MSSPRNRSCGRPTSPLMRRRRPCGSCSSNSCTAGSGGSPSSSRASRRGTSPCRSWSCITGSWTSTFPSPRHSAVLWTRTSSTTAGSGWQTRSTRSCSTGCATTSASAPAAGRPCPCTTGGGCATPATAGTIGMDHGIQAGTTYDNQNSPCMAIKK